MATGTGDVRLEDRLAQLLSDRLGAGTVVEGLTRLSGGASRETWEARVRAPGGEAAVIVLQRERGAAAATSRAMAVQSALLESAAGLRVPVPAVVALDAEGSVMGSPSIVVEHVEGETIARRILRDAEYATARSRLARQAGAALAGVHRIDAGSVPDLDASDQLQQMSDLLGVLGEPHPVFEIGLRRLRSTRPPSGEQRVLHGDFRMGNLVVGPDGLRAVLDWELAHLGDPAEDLGWFCVRAWRFGGAATAGGVGSVEDLIGGYVDAGGTPIPVATLRWWEAFGTLRWGVICMLQAATHLSGASRSVELAAIGRRIAENEEDLLELLAGSSEYEPTPAVAPSVEVGSPPQDRPTAAELLDAVGEYLVEVRDGAPGRLGFHARVAGNVVAMVRRELELGPAQADAHRDRLAGLGFDDDGELAAAIRSGAMDDRLDEVADVLREAVRDKLAVANPGYWRRP